MKKKTFSTERRKSLKYHQSSDKSTFRTFWSIKISWVLIYSSWIRTISTFSTGRNQLKSWVIKCYFRAGCPLSASREYSSKLWKCFKNSSASRSFITTFSSLRFSSYKITKNGKYYWGSFKKHILSMKILEWKLIKRISAFLPLN